MRRVIAALIVAVAVVSIACGSSRTTAFLAPRNGATVASPVHLEMSTTRYKVAPVPYSHGNSGHFHVMVDRPCLKPGEFIPDHTEHYEHFGGGQRAALLPLSPGRHRLCLQVGDGAHVALADTDTIEVVVK